VSTASIAYFLDSSVLISAFHGRGSAAKQAALVLLEPALTDADAAIAISPLGRYEVTRTLELGEPSSDHLLAQLDGFTTFDITDRIATLAAALFRQERAAAAAVQDQTWNPDRRRFDTFHIATALHHDLVLLTLDQGMRRLFSREREKRVPTP